MNRRSMLKLTAAGGAGMALTSQLSCGPKSVNAEVQVAETFLKVVAVELPNQKPTIDKILKVMDDFNADYVRGDFVNAASIFATLEGDVSQLISDVGVNLSDRIKMALVLVDAAVTGIASLLKSQANVPAVAVARSRASAAQRGQVTAIERRAAKVDGLFAAIRN